MAGRSCVCSFPLKIEFLFYFFFAQRPLAGGPWRHRNLRPAISLGALLRRRVCDWFRKLNVAHAFGYGWGSGSQVPVAPWATGERALCEKEV
jgi:hypothetical protein